MLSSRVVVDSRSLSIETEREMSRAEQETAAAVPEDAMEYHCYMEPRVGAHYKRHVSAVPPCSLEKLNAAREGERYKGEKEEETVDAAAAAKREFQLYDVLARDIQKRCDDERMLRGVGDEVGVGGFLAPAAPSCDADILLVNFSEAVYTADALRSLSLAFGDVDSAYTQKETDAVEIDNLRRRVVGKTDRPLTLVYAYGDASLQRAKGVLTGRRCKFAVTPRFDCVDQLIDYLYALTTSYGRKK